MPHYIVLPPLVVMELVQHSRDLRSAASQSFQIFFQFIGLTRSEKTSVMSTVNVRELISGRSTGRSTPPVDLPVDLNGNFRFLLLELILTDQLADLPPSRSASGSEWQFQILTA